MHGLALVLHSTQVLIVAAVTFVVIRAWRARHRYEEALAQMVERVVEAREAERQRIAYDLHDGVAPLIVIRALPGHRADVTHRRQDTRC